MKPAWDALGAEYKDSTSVLIGDADCTAGGQKLCEKFKVRGYPTIKYFIDGEEKDYQGGRDLASLKKFVEDNMGGGCDVNESEATCDARESKYMKKMMAKGPENLRKEIARLEKMKNDPMKPALKSWLTKRLSINKQLNDLLEGDDEDDDDDEEEL